MSILNPENYYIPCRHRLLGQATKQPLSNFEPQKLENISKLEQWGVTLVTYNIKKCIIWRKIFDDSLRF